jgi:hypothetical protein
MKFTLRRSNALFEIAYVSGKQKLVAVQKVLTCYGPTSDIAISGRFLKNELWLHMVYGNLFLMDLTAAKYIDSERYAYTKGVGSTVAVKRWTDELQLNETIISWNLTKQKSDTTSDCPF